MPPVLMAIDSPHAIVDDEVFTSLQTRGGVCGLEILHDIPSPDKAAHPTSLVLDEIWNVHWIRRDAPFMLLVPTHRRPFDGPLFSCLDYAHDIPLERNPTTHRWSLRGDLILEWHTLQVNLLVIWHALLKMCDGRMPQHVRFWAWPCRYGYRLTYKTRKVAQAIAARSRNAFIPLIASITFSMLFLHYLAEKFPEKYRYWQQDVVLSLNIHPEWFTLLEQSIIADAFPPRVGGIVDMSKWDFPGLLPILQRFDMPLLLFWGPIRDRLSLPDSVSAFAPDHKVINSLRSRRRIFSSTLSSSESPSIGPPPIGPPSIGSPSNDPLAGRRTFPRVEPHSDQRPNETMQEFFNRRRQFAEDYIKNHESPREREARLQRDANTSRHREPGRRGARVYWWEDVDGFHIRRAAGRLNYRMYWEEDGWERSYDPFYNEWDIWDSDTATKLNGCDTNVADFDDDFDDDLSDDLNSIHLLPPEQQIPCNEGRLSSVAQLERIHQILLPQDDAEAHNVAETRETIQASIAVEDVAYSRFGFIHSAILGNAKVDYPWIGVTRSLGLSWDQVFAPLQPVRDSLAHFFASQFNAKNYTHISPATYDLLQPDRAVHRREITVGYETLEGTKYYFLSSSFDDQCPYRLALTCASSVVQILRCQWGPTSSDIARQLLVRGIPFNTFIRAEFLQKEERLVPRFRGFGYRPHHFKPGKIDLKAYLARREQLLSSPRGRAALLQGGLVARIARPYVNFDDVCRGPTSQVMYDGSVLRSRHGYGYWDDSLTKDELDIICGVYCVDTGRRERGGPQTVQISFWPPPHIWAATGLDIGHWSSDCESWFIGHEQKIEAGTAKLLQGKDWRHTLQFSKLATRTVKNSNVLASQYLDEWAMPV